MEWKASGGWEREVELGMGEEGERERGRGEEGKFFENFREIRYGS